MSQFSSYSGYIGPVTGGGSGITEINGETGPAITIAPGQGINISNVGNTITINADDASTGTGLDIYVDVNNGSDVTGTGTVENPYQTILFAQNSFSDQSANKIYTLHLSSGFFLEDPSYVPKQFVNLVGQGIQVTYVAHNDNSPLAMTYNNDFFTQVFQGITFFGGISITSNGVGGGPIVTDLQSQFNFINCELPGSVTLTGSGNIGTGPFNFDIVFFQTCINHGSSPIHTHAFQTNIDSCDLGFVIMDMVGVDATNFDYLLSSWRNNSLRNITLSGTVDIRASTTKINRLRINDTNPVYEADAVSLPQNQGAIQLVGGSTINQISKTVFSTYAQNPTSIADSTPYSISPIQENIIQVNQAVPGPSTLNLPALTPGNQSSEGVSYVIADGKGDAATNNITIIANGTDTFQGGGTSIVIAENFGWRGLAYNNGVWYVTSSSNVNKFDYQYSTDRWVDVNNGSDSTGNGSFTNPWRTISFAETQITTATLLSPWTIYVLGSGQYFDAGLVNLKPNINIIGDGASALIIADPITVNAVAAADGAVEFRNMQIDGPLTYNGAAANTATLILTNCFVNQLVYTADNNNFGFLNVLGGGNGGLASADIKGFANIFSCPFYNSLTIEDGSQSVIISGCDLTGTAISLKGNSTLKLAGSTQAASLTATTVGGNNPVLISDSGSFPLSISGTLSATTYSSISEHVGYTPTTSTDWPVVPTTAKEALDELANTKFNVSTISSNTTALSAHTYLCNTSGGAFTLTLPTPTLNASVILKDSTGSFAANNLSVDPGAAKIDTVAGVQTLSTNFVSLTYVSNGTDWFLI